MFASDFSLVTALGIEWQTKAMHLLLVFTLKCASVKIHTFLRGQGSLRQRAIQQFSLHSGCLRRHLFCCLSGADIRWVLHYPDQDGTGWVLHYPD